jgi:hypothetical protein
MKRAAMRKEEGGWKETERAYMYRVCNEEEKIIDKGREEEEGKINKRMERRS